MNPVISRDVQGSVDSVYTLSEDKIGPLLANLRLPDVEDGAQRPGMQKLTSYVDSGSARSVCPRSFGAQFPMTATGKSQRGDGFQTATGKRLPNLGGRKITGTTETGENITMGYAVADVSVAVDSVGQICDIGATVTFNKNGGFIERANGK